MPERTLRLATIFSHPDDETFGTLIKYTAAGVKCHSLSVTQGEAGPNGDQRLERLRGTLDFVARDETYIRAFPDPGGPPLETDLFAGVKR